MSGLPETVRLGEAAGRMEKDRNDERRAPATGWAVSCRAESGDDKTGIIRIGRIDSRSAKRLTPDIPSSCIGDSVIGAYTYIASNMAVIATSTITMTAPRTNPLRSSR